MKTSSVIIIVLVVVVIALIVGSALSYLFAPSGSPWKSAAEYPLQVSDTLGVSGQQCVNSTAYIYCIGGADASGGPHNGVYTSSALPSSSGNITYWTLNSIPYPLSIFAQSCVASSGFVYCVGGTYDDAGDDVAYSYYAPLSSDGVVGAWTLTTPYPVPVDTQSCVASSGYIYCVGGFDEAFTSPGSELGYNASRALSNYVYYAPLSSSGIGTWGLSTPYPSDTYFPSCSAANGYIYCLGGVNGDGNLVSTDYSAPLSSSGVEAWTQTTSYEVQATGQECEISSGYIYCVGGEASSSYLNAVYYATVSSGNIGTWTKAGNYPQSIITDCVISSGYLYCVGGFNNSALYGTAYYISLESILGVATTTSG